VVSKIILLVFITALLGTILQTWGGSWDITNHQLGEPETFFTPSHAILYTGVGIGLICAIVSSIIILKNKEILKNSVSLGLKLIILGSILQIIAGPGDYYWHEIFGVDGLLSPTHLTLITGILIQSLGIVIGLARLIPYNFKATKPSLIFAFGVLWFIVIGFIFQFTLPISTGDTMDLDPDPYVAVIIATSTMPFFSTLIFWSAAKSIRKIGGASLVTLTFIVLNVTSNILPAGFLWIFLPWFAIPMILGIASDVLISKKIKGGENIAGAIIGSIFLVLSMPLIGMTFIQFYIFSGVSGYELLPEFTDTLLMILGAMSIPGAIVGIISIRFAKKRISMPQLVN